VACLARQALERFRREAKAAWALNHPSICTIYDIGEDAVKTFIAMEYLDGKRLKQTIMGRPMELERLLAVAIKVADGWRLLTQKASSTAISSLQTFSSPTEAMRKFSTLDWLRSNQRMALKKRRHPDYGRGK
jgi:Protein tyrosine and serine/threonine kinase